MSEAFGTAVGGTGLVAFAGAVVAVRAGVLDSFVAAAAPVVGVLVVVVAVGAAGSRAGFSGRMPAGRSVSVGGHAHGRYSSGGERRVIARHEAGHVAAARALGGKVVSAEVYDGNEGGLVRAQLPGCGPGPSITFLRAGRYAAGTSRGASADMSSERRLLREIPRAQRAQLSRACDQDAHRIVRASRAAIRRDELILDRKGSL